MRRHRLLLIKAILKRYGTNIQHSQKIRLSKNALLITPCGHLIDMPVFPVAEHADTKRQNLQPVKLKSVAGSGDSLYNLAL